MLALQFEKVKPTRTLQCGRASQTRLFVASQSEATPVSCFYYGEGLRGRSAHW
jgi:hypothetical protein|eukprot:COSAG02_NODE_43_length_45989_cov_93.430181_16_plen_53_part_00